MPSRFLVALAAIVMLATPVHAEQLVNKIAAVVNGEIVTLYDLKQLAIPELKKAGVLGSKYADSPKVKSILSSVLENIVTEKLFLQDAERRGITVDEAEIENELRKLAQQRGLTLAKAKEQIIKDGLTVDSVKERVRASIIRQRLLGLMVGRKVVITKEEVERFYEKNKAEFAADGKIELSLLIFGDDSNVSDVRSELAAGKISFEEAVQKYSVGPGKEQGGYLGELGVKDISPQMMAAVDTMEDGAVSNVLSLGSNKALIKLHSKTKGSLRPLDEVAQEIEAKLRAPRLEASFKEYAEKLRNNAVVDVRL
ncbi:peptidyl-prolyl cis-trans isomerase [Halodesulfovibrio sp.]|jgi:peptidyl-prolyl cis-trans isomerase SurA|uniref:peptidyl-prolyl cis-trans isomerase n=1 Tax=Halodesulfovibrio sp. TaxID=1912772 RepID=UPI0025EB3144|nr:peptidyl-prolyl cis-trans isomerase [Halodesulfovibrio sp.]MCT4533842.1 peptidyl-prolyl cis-trans isomerase [Halodesulfovibrio sp.]